MEKRISRKSNYFLLKRKRKEKAKKKLFSSEKHYIYDFYEKV